jgi:short-subunit dehydrogenase
MSQRRFSLFRSVPPVLIAAAAAAAAAAYLARAQRRIAFAGKTVVISGGSRGLGLELGRGFAAEGADLVLLARDPNSLARAAIELRQYGARVTTMTCDVTDRARVRQAVASIYETICRIDVLVNNAGTIQVGPIENMKLEDYQNALGVHFWGPLYLMEEVIPRMKARRQGRIVNIASIGGKVAVPHLSPYVASKFALVGLSEGLRAELLKDGIYVTTVCPGLMRTGSHLNAYFKGQRKKEFALFAIANASPLFSTAAHAAARKIIDACRYGRAEIVITPQAGVLQMVHGLFPGLMSEVFALVNYLLPKTAGREGDATRLGRESRSPLAASALTRRADRAAARNNELAPAAGSRSESAGAEAPTDDEDKTTRCLCTHPTHFMGRCQAEVSPPEHTCAACMENHFHRIDDPAI